MDGVDGALVEPIVPAFDVPFLVQARHSVFSGSACFATRPKETMMADLTPLDEKLAEVLGLAQAAQTAAETVAKMEDAEDFSGDLSRMREQAAETERRASLTLATQEVGG
jgi:hypothetical protein